MEVKEIVKIAIDYITSVFDGEELFNLGLEEIIYDEEKETWRVTVGFSRHWDREHPGILASVATSRLVRRYKIVEVRDKDGKVTAIKMRD